ncbi:glycosyltransferase family 2 protein [bacterium]|nr:glycosyltransferase family 2 protein [bacterium]
MPKVSIIIPVYNVEKYLRQCLDSVVNQTLKDIEIICVNDCSPDNSLAILQEYSNKDNRIKIIDLKENGGLGNARNVAFQQVTSDYIMFLDSDDWLELNACEIAYNQIAKYNNDFVIFNLFQFFENSGKKKQIYFKIKPFLQFCGEKKFSFDDINNPCLANCECWYKIYKTSFLIENDIKFTLGAFEDQTFNCKLFALASSISVINKTLYNYRIRKGSITTNAKNYVDYINAKKQTFEYLDTIENLDRKNKLINFWIIHSIELTLVNFKKCTKINKTTTNEYYLLLRKFYIYIDKKYSLKAVKHDIDYKKAEIIIKNKSYLIYKLYDFIYSIYSVRNMKNRIVITFLWITFKIKK